MPDSVPSAGFLTESGESFACSPGPSGDVLESEFFGFVFGFPPSGDVSCFGEFSFNPVGRLSSVGFWGLGFDSCPSAFDS